METMKAKYDEAKQKYKYILLCAWSSKKIPSQEIHLTIEGLKENSCFFTFKHVFNEKIKEENLESLSKEKISIIKCLQKYFA